MSIIKSPRIHISYLEKTGSVVISVKNLIQFSILPVGGLYKHTNNIFLLFGFMIVIVTISKSGVILLNLKSFSEKDLNNQPTYIQTVLCLSVLKIFLPGISIRLSETLLSNHVSLQHNISTSS